MRRTRLRRFRKKNRPLMIALKTVIIGYLLMFSVSYLTAETVAYFDGQKQVSEILITAGTWDDEEAEDPEEPVSEAANEEDSATKNEEEKNNSSLAFTDEEMEHSDTCPALIEVEITNEGDEMSEDGFYEVYYAETGNPEEDGEKVELNEDEGVIEALGNNETVTLTHETDNPGVYIFVAYEHEDDSKEDWLWSEEITVDCDLDEDEAQENKTSDNEENAEEEAQENESEADNAKETEQDPTNDDDSTNSEDVENEETEDHEVD